MSTSARIGFALAGFYVIAALGYYLTGHDLQGFPLLLSGAVGIALLGGYAALAVRKAERQLAAEQEEAEEREPHVGPTIWPFGYAIAAVVLVIGAVLSPWALLPGGLLFVAASVGWFTDVRRQWRHPGETPAIPAARPAAEAPLGAAHAPEPGARHRRLGRRARTTGGPR